MLKFASIFCSINIVEMITIPHIFYICASASFGYHLGEWNYLVKENLKLIHSPELPFRMGVGPIFFTRIMYCFCVLVFVLLSW